MTRTLSVERIGSDVTLDEARPFLLARLAARSKSMPNGCIEWTASKNRQGYARISALGRYWAVTRLVLALDGRAPTDEQEACHRCDNPSCINPAHLFPGTPMENTHDSMRKGRHWSNGYTHCVRGHEFTPENTRVVKSGKRHCRECSRIRQRLKAGWPEDKALVMPPTPHGYRPVNGRFHMSKMGLGDQPTPQAK